MNSQIKRNITIEAIKADITRLDLEQKFKLSSVACSSDGEVIYLGGYGCPIYLSLDVGVTWNKTSLGELTWDSIACSSNGQTALAVADFDFPYFSTDFGKTWNRLDPCGTNNAWQSCSLSSDGNRALMQVCCGNIFKGIRDIPANKATFSCYILPSDGGTSVPEGCVEVNLAEKFELSAIPAEAYSFAGWVAGPGCKIDDLSSPNTNAICDVNSYASAFFTRNKINMKSLKLNYFSSNAFQEKVEVFHGDLPEMPPNFNPQTCLVKVHIGNVTLTCSADTGVWKNYFNGYKFTSNKDKPFRFQLQLNTRDMNWNFKSTGYPLGTPTNLSHVVAGISINEYTYTSLQRLSAKSSWSYKNPQKVSGFQIGKMNGSTGIKPGDGSLYIGSSSIPNLPEGFGDVSLTINNLKIEAPASDFIRKKQKYKYEGQTAAGKIILFFDLKKNKWSFKISKVKEEDINKFAESFGSVTITLKIGENSLLQLNIDTSQSSKLEKAR